MEDKEKKAAEIALDGDEGEQETEAALEEESKEEKKDGQKAADAGAQLRELCRGTLELMQPFMSRDIEVTELPYDFCGLSNEELFEALDSVPMNNMFAISNAQAMAVFCATAGKCAPKYDDGHFHGRLYDARDVKSRLGSADAIKAIQLAKLFYTASSQAGNKNISKK